MKILFVYSVNSPNEPKRPLESQDEMQFGISLISAYLQRHGHQTELLVLTRKTDKTFIIDFVKNFDPSLIAFTAVTTEYPLIEEISQILRIEYPEIFFLIGGVHVTLNPEEKMLKTFNAICIGEGERSTLELVRQLEGNQNLSLVPNLWFLQNGQCQKNSIIPFEKNLDELPFADRRMWQRWIKEPKSRFSLLLGRGCPYSCTYCSNHALRKTAEGRYVRFRSPENILAEIDHITKYYPFVREIYLEVETFGAARFDDALTLCMLLEKFNANRSELIEFGINFRLIKFRDKLAPLFEAISKANIRYLNIGLESGSERVRNEILKRPESNEDIIKTVRLAKSFGIQVRFYNLVGIPGESKEEFKETIRMNQICQPDFNYLSIFYPYSGTDLHAKCIEMGLISPGKPLQVQVERIFASFDSPVFTAREVEFSYIWFDFMVYRNTKSVNELLNSVIGNYLYVYGNQGKLKLFLWFRISSEILKHSIKTMDFIIIVAFIRKIMKKILGKFR